MKWRYSNEAREWSPRVPIDIKPFLPPQGHNNTSTDKTRKLLRGCSPKALRGRNTCSRGRCSDPNFQQVANQSGQPEKAHHETNTIASSNERTTMLNQEGATSRIKIRRHQCRRVRQPRQGADGGSYRQHNVPSSRRRQTTYDQK